MKRYIELCLGVAMVMLLSACRKETTELYPDKSRFYLNDSPQLTPNGLFQINDTTGSNFTLFFYSSGIVYDVPADAFAGSGPWLAMNISASIFKPGMQGQLFSVDNMEEGIIDINGGVISASYDFASGTGTVANIQSGRLTLWKYRDLYKINYRITLEDNSVVEGAFFDGIIVAYK